MPNHCAAVVAIAVASGALPLVGLAQVILTSQERTNNVSVALGNGAEDFGFAQAPGYGLFYNVVPRSLSEPNGGGAEGTAGQLASVSATSIQGGIGAESVVRTGSTFVTGEASARSNFLVLFTVSAPTPIQFSGDASITLAGLNPDGEPSDLYGRANVRLINADTEAQIAGISLFPAAGSDAFSFNGVLPAGSYALLAQAESYAFSADLLGPPARSGRSYAEVNFNFSVVPAPGAAATLALGGLLLGARRRR